MFLRLDDGLVLVSDHLFFFFEITDNLLKTLLKNLNLFFVLLRPPQLEVLSPHVFLLGSVVDIDIPFKILVHFLQIGDFSFIVVDRIPLSDRLLCQL